MGLPQATSQLGWEVLIAPLADWFQVYLKELGLLIHLLVAH